MLVCSSQMKSSERLARDVFDLFVFFLVALSAALVCDVTEPVQGMNW